MPLPLDWIWQWHRWSPSSPAETHTSDPNTVLPYPPKLYLYNIKYLYCMLKIVVTINCFWYLKSYYGMNRKASVRFYRSSIGLKRVDKWCLDWKWQCSKWEIENSSKIVEQLLPGERFDLKTLSWHSIWKCKRKLKSWQHLEALIFDLYVRILYLICKRVSCSSASEFVIHLITGFLKVPNFVPLIHQIIKYIKKKSRGIH